MNEICKICNYRSKRGVWLVTQMTLMNADSDLAQSYVITFSATFQEPCSGDAAGVDCRMADISPDRWAETHRTR